MQARRARRRRAASFRLSAREAFCTNTLPGGLCTACRGWQSAEMRLYCMGRSLHGRDRAAQAVSPAERLCAMLLLHTTPCRSADAPEQAGEPRVCRNTKAIRCVEIRQCRPSGMASPKRQRTRRTRSPRRRRRCGTRRPISAPRLGEYAREAGRQAGACWRRPRYSTGNDVLDMVEGFTRPERLGLAADRRRGRLWPGLPRQEQPGLTATLPVMARVSFAAPR